MPNTPTALVVDDDPTQLYVLARLARLAGFAILEASSGEMAYSTAQEEVPAVVVADIRIPDFDGFELCRRLKANEVTRRIPVILVTSMYYQHDDTNSAYETGRSEAKQAGAKDLLLRGDALEALVPVLQKIGKSRARRNSARRATKKRVQKPAKQSKRKALAKSKKSATKKRR